MTTRSNKNSAPRSGEYSLAQKLTASTLITLGAVSLSGCGEKVDAQPAGTAVEQTTDTQTPATETATVETASPETTEETTPANPETYDAYSNITGTPEYKTYVENLTPEKLAAMSSEAELVSAFEVTPEKLPKVDTAGNPISVAEAYVVFVVASREAQLSAGTWDEVESFGPGNCKDFRIYALNKYAYSHNQAISPASAGEFNTTTSENIYSNNCIVNDYYHKGELDQPQRVSVDIKQINVLKEGDGVNAPFTAEVELHYNEQFDEKKMFTLAEVSPRLDANVISTVTNVRVDDNNRLVPQQITDVATE